MTAYYNEIDPYAAQWLRNLMAKKLIPSGEVDERSIIDVPADDLKGFIQCHFFAGIGGWPYALRLAGWFSYYENRTDDEYSVGHYDEGKYIRVGDLRRAAALLEKMK